jgi:hypothetical protein
VNDQGRVTSTNSSHKLAHVKVSVVGWRVGEGEGASDKVGTKVGENVTVGLIVTDGSGVGTGVGTGDGIQVPIVQVSLVGDDVGA